MSSFTDRLYRAWAIQNGYSGPRYRPNGGMGAVAPMQSPRRPYGASSGRGTLPPHLGPLAARPEKQKTPASATNTPGAVINIRERNADGTHCRS